jgi:hypothetical protein
VELWQEGYAFKELREKRKALEAQKEEIDRYKKQLAKKKSAKVRLGSSRKSFTGKFSPRIAHECAADRDRERNRSTFWNRRRW